MSDGTDLSRIADLLLRHGAEVSAASLIHAAGLSDLALLRSLLDAGAPIDERDDRGRTALILAASFGDIDTVDLLMNGGANPLITDSAGLNAADWSIMGGFATVTRRLASAGVNPGNLVIEEKPETPETVVHSPAQFTKSRYLLDGLLHITASGVRVRSKSEIVIADALHYLEIPFEYELPFIGSRTGGMRLPDFTFRRRSGQVILWEHLGMLHQDDYRRNWQRKLGWYLDNRLVEGQTLFITQDDPRGGLDSRRVNTTARRIRDGLDDR